MFKLLMYFWEKRKEDEESNVFMNNHFTIFMKSQRKRFFSFYLLEWLLKTVESALNQLLITKLVVPGLLYCNTFVFYTSTCSSAFSFPFCYANLLFISFLHLYRISTSQISKKSFSLWFKNIDK